eukprot:490540-Pleurochrysis_carterae.AAC.1
MAMAQSSSGEARGKPSRMYASRSCKAYLEGASLLWRGVVVDVGVSEHALRARDVDAAAVEVEPIGENLVGASLRRPDALELAREGARPDDAAGAR